MRNVLLCVFILALAAGTIPTGTASAQCEAPFWEINTVPYPDRVYLPAVCGWVGIGTDYPEKPLDVRGAIQVGKDDDWATIRSNPDSEQFLLKHFGTGSMRLTFPDTLLISRGTTTVVEVGDESVDVAGDLSVSGTTSTAVLQITGADLAEPFDISGDNIVPGLVASIDPERPGMLKVSELSYDRTVIGVVSGAGGIKTGALLGTSFRNDEASYPVALTGRVYVKADATSGPIQPGDLLTTSSTAGHVMKVTDHDRANGAILGKAMSGLEDGDGMVLMVVALQ